MKMTDIDLDASRLHSVQLQMEQEALDLGAARYRTSLEREGEESMPPGLRLIRTVVAGRDTKPGLGKIIAAHLDDVKTRKPSRASGCYDFLKQFQTDAVAFIAVRQALHGMTRQMSVQKTSLSIAKALEMHQNIDDLHKRHPLAYRSYMKLAKKRPDRGSRLILLRRAQDYVGAKYVRWGQSDELKVGHFLLDLVRQYEVVEGYHLIEFIRPMTEWGGPGGAMVVKPTEWTMRWLAESHERSQMLAPIYGPMVTKPLPWTGPFGGGYLTKQLRYPLIKRSRPEALAELKKWAMPKVYCAVNALQETEWCVNTAVLNVVEEMWKAGGGHAGLPHQNPLPLPAKNFPADAKGDDPAVIEWKRRATKVHDENHRMISKRLAAMCQIDLARKLAAYECFYFPHALDWRGRAYPVSSHLTPQSNDLGKGLLQFTAGCALGDNGAFWLATHGSNCYGVDKVSYDDRVRWVQDHEEDILACAMRPLETIGFWGAAGDPFQFLAFCFEWSGLVIWHRSGKSMAEYVSRLPVGLDGSCNGLQQFSALLRDEVGGRATNLIPSETPSDIYAAVALVAQKMIDEDAAGGNEMAQRWVGKITRKLTKRNTMTVPYGVTQIGMRDQLVAEFKKLREEAVLSGRDPREWEATGSDCQYLAGVNYRAIGQVVVAAREAMDWLKEVARVASQTGKAIKWVAPSGMLVVQNYREVLGQRVETHMTGTRTQLMLTMEGDKLDRRKMSMGISPNFVHSLDAAHMVATVTAGLEKGLASFAMVHDSYGTHAGNIDVLAVTLRETFVQQYQGDLLGDYRAQLIAQLPEGLAVDVPPCPQMGNLEVAQVLNSHYFFA